MQTGLKDRVVILAAASRGIGRACADLFAREGSKLAICSRDEKQIETAAQELRDAYSVDVLSRAIDVTNEKAVHGFVNAVAEKFGRVDVCFTNAGGPPARNFLSLSSDDWRKAFELNFMSTVHFARAVIPWMQKNRWGRLITLTSVSVKQPIPDLVLSNSVRAGIMGLVRSLANEFGRDGITVNNVGPGYTATDRLKELAATRALAAGVNQQEMFDRWARDTAVGRVADPSEVANAVLWLASEGAAMVTGQTILVDGGSYKGL